MSSPKPLNVGLIGGGGGAFIANPHQKAIHFDGTRRVHSVALHPDPEVAMNEAENWPYPVKGYGNYDELIAGQATLTEDERLDCILVVTPNCVHFDPVMKACQGFSWPMSSFPRDAVWWAHSKDSRWRMLSMRLRPSSAPVLFTRAIGRFTFTGGWPTHPESDSLW